MARDHYHGFSHPVLVDIPIEPPCDLLSEMDIVADELRTNPEHIVADDQIAFRQLSRLRGFNFTKTQFLDLYDLWREFYRARGEAREVARREYFNKLCTERAALFEECMWVLPAERAEAVTARIAAIGRELAALQPWHS